MSRLSRAAKELHDPLATLADLRRARRSARERPHVATLMRAIREDGLTYIRPVNLWGLADALHDLDERGIDGAVVEAGTALGGSAIMLAKLRTRPRPVLVFDAFGMIPPPSERDGEDVHARYEEISAGRSRGLKGDTYYGYRDDLLGDVTRSFERYGQDIRTSDVTLVPGTFDRSLHVDQPVALAHIDCDWYESTQVALERITPHVVPGGRVVIDDYFTYSGCRSAVDEFLAATSDFEVHRRTRLHLVRR